MKALNAGGTRFFFLWLSVCTALFASSSPISPAPGIPAEKTALENGLALIHERAFFSGRTAIKVLIKGGKRAEPAGRDGLSYLTTRLAVNIPDQRKIQDLMAQATHLSVNTQRDYSLISISCLSENLEDSLDTITKIMLDPLFSGLRINAIKRQMQRRRDALEDDSIAIAHGLLFDVFFHGSSYAGSIYGTEESLEAIEKKDIEAFYEKHFVGGNMLVSVSSDLERETIRNVIEKYFSKFSPGVPAASDPLRFSPPQKKEYFRERETEQTLVSVAYPLEKMTPRNFVLASLLENLLGKGFHSKLWPLRIQQKLAYVVNSRATLMREAGILEAYLETESAKKDKARQELDKVMLSLYENGLTREELESTKTNTRADFLRDIENKDERAATLAYFEAMDLGHDFIDRYFDELASVTLDEMNAFIKGALEPAHAVSVIVGAPVS